MQNFGDFFVTHLLQIPEDDCRTEARIDLLEYFRHQMLRLQTRYAIERRLALIGQYILIAQPVVVGTVQPHFLTAMAAEKASLVVSFIDRDAVYPCL